MRQNVLRPIDAASGAVPEAASDLTNRAYVVRADVLAQPIVADVFDLRAGLARAAALNPTQVVGSALQVKLALTGWKPESHEGFRLVWTALSRVLAVVVA